MPYSIRKLPNKNLYRVRQMNSGKIAAKGTTLKKAQAQVRLLYMMNRIRK
jgi:hypothetical protein